MDGGEWMAGKNSDVKWKETGRGKAGELDGILTVTGFCLVGGVKLQSRCRLTVLSRQNPLMAFYPYLYVLDSTVELVPWSYMESGFRKLIMQKKKLRFMCLY